MAFWAGADSGCSGRATALPDPWQAGDESFKRAEMVPAPAHTVSGAPVRFLAFRFFRMGASYL